MSDTKKTAAAAEAASLQEDMDAVMRKYDRESATRIWAGKPKIVISVVMALFSVYCIWSTLFSTAALEVRLTASSPDHHHGLSDLSRQQEARARQSPAVV